MVSLVDDSSLDRNLLGLIKADVIEILLPSILLFHLVEQLEEVFMVLVYGNSII
jgi:hypothetical protein